MQDKACELEAFCQLLVGTLERPATNHWQRSNWQLALIFGFFYFDEMLPLSTAGGKVTVGAVEGENIVRIYKQGDLLNLEI